MRNLVPLLALAACPLMMVFCMRSMRRGQCSDDEAESRAKGAEEAALRAEMADLREQIATMRAKQNLAASRPDVTLED